jgi:type II secretory pathway predicted ATPase ExeA
MNLATILADIGISQRQFGRDLHLSKTVANRVATGNWPLRGRQELVIDVGRWLAERGVTAERVAEFVATNSAPSTYRKETAPTVLHTDGATPEAPPITIDPQEEFMLLRNETLTPAARQHFGLRRSPFVDDVCSLADVFVSAATRRARAGLMDAALNHGFVALFGESGSGKSTLREELEQRILDEGRPVILIMPYIVEMEPNETRGRPLKSIDISEAIVSTIAPGRSMCGSAQARTKQVHELLSASAQAGASHLLIIEEAHRLPKSTLKHLKNFMELKRGMQRLLGVALIGQNELRDSLLVEQDPEVREIVQRCELIELPPLDNDLEPYLRHKFERTGAVLGDIFADDAIDAMRARLVKIPRGGSSRDAVSTCHPLVVNNLTTRAMNAAAATGFRKVTGQIVGGC